MVIPFAANAQKLPYKQEISLWAPAKVKIDGKATELNNVFQAYNKATDIFYTISNDNDHLYLTVQATYLDIIRKIISGGVSLFINKSDKKVDAGAIAITYPVFNSINKPQINFIDKPEIVAGSKSSVMRADSFMRANNTRLVNNSKYIKVTGIKNLDPLISVYNEEGIKASALFDNKMVYTYELAVPLKLLDLSANSQTKFNYNITLNEIQLEDMPGVNIKMDSKGTITSVIIDRKLTPKMNISSPTYFWAEYTLATK